MHNGALVLPVLLSAILSATAAPAASTVVWTYTCAGGFIDCSPASGDINGDGRNEVVVVTTAGSVLALDGGATEIWRYDTHDRFSVPPTLADVTGGPGLEAVVLANSGAAWCLEAASGAVLWQSNLPGLVDWGRAGFAAADLDRNGSVELVAADSLETMTCLSGDGKILWSHKHPGIFNTYPAIADLDADGFSEILAGAMDTPLLCLSHDGKEQWRLPKEGAEGSTPLAVDFIGNDGIPEILVGIGNAIAAVDNAGKILWTYPMRRDVDCAIAAADVDNDGSIEIFAADLGGKFVCLSPDGGLKWEADVEQRVRRNPAIADIDGDGVVEILLAGYSKKLYVFDPKGFVEETVALDGEANATPTVVDFAGNGRLSVVLPLTTGRMLAFQWPQQKPDPVVLVPEFRLNSARTGSTGPGTDKPEITIPKFDCGNLYVGSNRFEVLICNPESRPLDVDLAVLRDGVKFSATNLAASQTQIEETLLYTLDGAAPATLAFVCTVSEAGKPVAERRQQVYVVPFMKELGDLGRLAGQIRDALPKLKSKQAPENLVYRIQALLPQLKDRAALASTMTSGQRTALAGEFAQLRDAAIPMAEMTAAAAEKGTTFGALCVNPWSPFKPMQDSPSIAGQITAFGGEIESGAINLLNLSDSTRVCRVDVGALKKGDVEKQAVTVREVVPVPTQMLDQSWDALPLLNEARTIVVPPWDARQVWLTIDTAGLSPGIWEGEIRFRTLDVDSVETSPTFSVEVYNARLPEKQPLHLCHWGYVHTSVLKDQPEAALEDQVSHGTNVFVGIQFPQATCDDAGNIVGQIDFAEHDDYVKRYAPHGMILFCGYQGALKGVPQSSDGWKKAHVQYLRAWVAHLAQLGVGYDGFALYPVDEPGLSPGLSDILIAMGKLAREADPKIRMYTDPVGSCTMEELRAMAPYVDIWCPNRNGYLIKHNADKLEFIKSTGGQVWTYECDDNAKHQSPLGYYRGQAWLAWHHGLTGIGFWSYCTSKDDPWYRADREYLLIYQGNGVVPSKRWEAIRDGIEDYSMLATLRDAADAAQREGRAPDTVAEARRLLTQDADEIADFCGRDQDGTVPGSLGPAGDRAVAWKRWCRIRDIRAKMARLLESLQ